MICIVIISWLTGCYLQVCILARLKNESPSVSSAHWQFRDQMEQLNTKKHVSRSQRQSAFVDITSVRHSIEPLLFSLAPLDRSKKVDHIRQKNTMKIRNRNKLELIVQNKVSPEFGHCCALLCIALTNRSSISTPHLLHHTSGRDGYFQLRLKC